MKNISIWGFPKIRGTFKGVYRGYIGIMEKKMETTLSGLGFRVLGFPKLGVPTIMENQMEKKMENEMEPGFI